MRALLEFLFKNFVKAMNWHLGPMDYERPNDED